MRRITLAVPLLLAACSGAPGGDWYADSSSLSGTSGYSDDDGDSYGDGDGDGDGDDEEQPEGTDTDDPACNDVDDVVLYLSPDDSNSMSAPVQLRELVLRGEDWTWAVAIRVWEFMNYYTFDLPPAPKGSLAPTAALRERTTTGRYDLMLAVSSEQMTDAQRPRMNLTLVLDTSGSMDGEPIELLRDSCRAIAASLSAGDTVSIVEWANSDEWTLVAHEVTSPNDPVLLAEIDATEANGATDLNGGLISGYNLAQQVWDPEAINRLVLISDGGANAGVTDIALIADNALYGGEDGIYLVGAGVGRSTYDDYSDELMDTVTDAGKGRLRVHQRRGRSLEGVSPELRQHDGDRCSQRADRAALAAWFRES